MGFPDRTEIGEKTFDKWPAGRQREEMEEKVTEVIEFTPKTCPTCQELLSCRKLGCWGYFCTRCLMWWGTYDPYPIVKTYDESGAIVETKKKAAPKAKKEKSAQEAPEEKQAD